MELEQILKDNYNSVKVVLGRHGVEKVNVATFMKLYEQKGDNLLEELTLEIEGSAVGFLSGVFTKIKTAVQNVDKEKLKSTIGSIKGLFSKENTVQDTAKEAIPKETSEPGETKNNIYMYAGLGVAVLFLSVVVYIKFYR